MTTPLERSQAVVAARAFLEALTSPRLYPELPAEVRERAEQLLRNYPFIGDVRRAARAAPDWWGDP